MKTVLCWWLLMLVVVLEANAMGFIQPNDVPGLGSNANPNDRLQTWSEWVRKRGLGGQARVGLGLPSAGLDRGQFSRWTELAQVLAPRKRQLETSPDPFGLHSRYFTNGLQDWRSTFPGSGRGPLRK